MMKSISDNNGSVMRSSPEKTDLCFGIMALSDCAVLAVAKEKDFFAQYGLNVRLSKEASWANIRDRIVVGELDGAQMLAAMPIAASLGIDPFQIPMITAFSLGLNGNAITASESLVERILQANSDAMSSPLSCAKALKKVIARFERKLVFAHVYPYSSHNYELRYWLASAGIDPDKDVRLVVIPPAQMVSHLKAGDIDGYCVGEPWNGQAVRSGIGRTLLTSYDLWNNKPEKVFAVTRDWVDKYPVTHQNILMSMMKAAQWADIPDNRDELAEILSGKGYVNAPLDVVSASLHGKLEALCRHPARPLPDFNVFFRYAASFPWVSHAQWFISQMYRWGQIRESLDIRRAAMSIYRPDLYRQAAQQVGIACPQHDQKVEGRHGDKWMFDEIEMGRDMFFDNSVFDPDQIVDYIARFKINNLAVDIGTLISQDDNRADAQ